MPSVAGLNFGPPEPAPAGDWLDLLDVGDGGWMTNIQTPRALSYGGFTYVGFSKATGEVQIVAIDESTGTPGTPITVHTFSPGDSHNTPALLVRDSDHKLLVCYSGHNNGQMFRRVSTTSLDTDPDLGDGFEAETNLHAQLASWASYTYPILVQLTSVTNDPIYLMWRERHGTERLRYSKSTDGGATFGASVAMTDSVSSSAGENYWAVATNGTDRFDVFFCDYSDGIDSQVHHFYYDGTDFKTSDGTTIISEAALIASGGADALQRGDMTLVLANTDGPVERVMGACWDGSAPAAVGWQRHTSGTDNRAVSVRWRSGAWQLDTVVESVGGLLDGFLYLSGAWMHPTDPDLIVAAKKVGGVFEMFRYTSADDGGTWSEEQITDLSVFDNMQPVVVTNATADLQGLWHYGTFESDFAYSVGLRGVAA